MKVLEFAFVAGEDSDYLPHNYDKNCVVYTGTHDNDTLQGWYQTLSEEDKEMTKEYLNNPYTPDEEVHWDFISLAMRSEADTCIIPVRSEEHTSRNRSMPGPGIHSPFSAVSSPYGIA